MVSQHSISRVRYTLKSGSSSSVIKLSSNCSFADSNGYINLVVFNKLAYVYWRGLKLHSVGAWTDGFTINKKLANNNAWIDVVLSNGKSSISDCGFEARGDTCVLVFNNTSSDAVKTSAFTILELAQHSISQVTLKTVNGITCTYRVWSKKVVECCVSGTTTNTLSSGSVIDFGTIPSGLRPKTTSFIICNVLWNGGKVYFRTYNDGSVSVLCADQEFSGGSSVRCSRTWIIQHSISQVEYFASESNTFNVTPKISGIVEVECVVHSTFGAWANKLSARIATPDGLTLIAGTASAVNGNDQVLRSFRARAVFSGVKSGSAYNFSVYRTDGSFGNSPSFSWFITVRQY